MGRHPVHPDNLSNSVIVPRQSWFSACATAMMGVVLALLISACEAVSPSLDLGYQPTLVRLDPDSSAADEAVVVYGSGFSPEEDNIILIDGTVVVETDWDVADTGLAGEAEQVSFVVPNTLAAGEYRVSVMIGDEVSNALLLTIE